MDTFIRPQPSRCASCGSAFAEPFCEHVLMAFAALAADPAELRDVDYFADVEALFDSDEPGDEPEPELPRRRYSATDLRRGYCPTATYYVVRRG